MLIALVGVVLACGVGCSGRDAKAVAVVQKELALLKPPVGIAPTDERVGLGEMYAEGGQTYCVSDEKAGQVALDSMLRNAGWEPVSTSTTAEAIVWPLTGMYKESGTHVTLTMGSGRTLAGRVDGGVFTDPTGSHWTRQ